MKKNDSAAPWEKQISQKRPRSALENVAENGGYIGCQGQCSVLMKQFHILPRETQDEISQHPLYYVGPRDWFLIKGMWMEVTDANCGQVRKTFCTTSHSLPFSCLPDMCKPHVKMLVFQDGRSPGSQVTRIQATQPLPRYEEVIAFSYVLPLIYLDFLFLQHRADMVIR